MAEHASKCVSGTDGDLTKLLKCSTSPTVANQFHVKIPGYGEHSALRPKLSDDCDRVVVGEILEARIPGSKKDPDISQPVLVLVFESTEIEALNGVISNGLRTHFKALPTRISTHNIGDLSGNNIEPLIADAQKEFQNVESTVKHLKPAIVGFFCKPDDLGKPGSSARQELEFDRLRRMYADLKFYCHTEGYHFAGTFLKSNIRWRGDDRMSRAVSNTVRRLRAKVESANAPASIPGSGNISRKMLLLGIHVSELQAAGWYLVSFVAKWSGSGGFHRARTFLQKSCTSTKGHSFPGALAMATTGREVIDELVDGASLANSTIVVLRAGVPPGKLSSEEISKLNVTHYLETNPEEQRYEQHVADATVDEGVLNTVAGTAVMDENGVEGTFGAHLANIDPEFNSEIGVLRDFAHNQKARLVNLTVTASTKARLFDQWGQPLFQETGSIDEEQGTDKVAVRPVSSILAPHSRAASGTATVDWLIQKRTAEQAGPNTPLLLKYHSIDQQGIDDDSMREALSEACWDFPATTWSSKSLSCVALAKKANRHAMRVVQFKNGEPSLPKVHADLQESLYFI
jgi:hypothetical protein